MALTDRVERRYRHQGSDCSEYWSSSWGSRYEDNGIYGTEGKVPGEPDIQATTGFHYERVGACCCARSR